MGKERQRLEIYEDRLAIFFRDHGICKSCGKTVSINEFEIAHKICQSIANRKRYGDEVIDHPLNKATTHPGRCNSAMNCGFKPDECRRIVEEIEREKDGR